MEKIRLGILGVGNIGRDHVKRIVDGKCPEIELCAVCDLKQDRLDYARELAGEALPVFKSAEEMMDSGLIDSVLVSVPHYDHPKFAMMAMEKGLHVLIEKPAGVYTKQVKEMNAAAEQSSAKFAMMFNQRTNCLYRKMREIVQSGGIGELQRVTWIITDWYRTQQYYDSGSWRATWEGEGGGVLINQCPHQIDLVQWVVGELPETVNAFCQYGKWHDIEVEDEVTAYFRYKNGATGVFITTTGETPGTNRFEISGSKGKLLCENGKLLWYKNEVDGFEWSKTSTEGFKKPKCEKIEVETDGLNPQHEGIINNFANALLGMEPFFVEGKEGLNGVELMNAIELSGWNNGEEIRLPVDEDRYLRELNAHRAVSRLKVCDDSAVTDTTGTFGGK